MKLYGSRSHSATPKLHDCQPVGIGRFPCELPLAVLTPGLGVGSILFPYKNPRFSSGFYMGRMMGLEPTASGATNQRSNLLSYIRHVEARMLFRTSESSTHHCTKQRRISIPNRYKWFCPGLYSPGHETYCASAVAELRSGHESTRLGWTSSRVVMVSTTRPVVLRST